MQKKMNIADFAALVGTTSKTIYAKINNSGNLPVNEQLKTVREKIKGREITVIVTDDEQIEFYKKLYGKNTVNDGEYYETVTDNNGYKLSENTADKVRDLLSEALDVNIFDKFITFNEEYNNRLEQKNTELKKVYEELSTVKSKQLLLEDKAGREGYYLNEINKLEKENNRNKLYNKLLLTVITVLLLFITGFMTYNIAVNKNNEPVLEQNSATVEQISEVQEQSKSEAQKPVQKPTKRTRK